MSEVARTTLTIVEDGAEVGSLTLRAPSLEKPRNLPGFPGEQDGFALYLGINGFPVAGIAFPVVQEKVELSRSTYLVWPLKVEDKSTEDAYIAVRGRFRADFDGEGMGGHGRFRADLFGEGMGGHGHFHADFFGQGMGGHGRVRADFRGEDMGGHGEFHADFTWPAVELQIRSRRVNVGNVGQLMRYCFRRLADQREGTLSLRLARVTYDQQVAALCSQPYLGSASATDSDLQRRPDALPKSSFSLTFGNEVSAKDVASFLSFLHKRAVAEGGLGLILSSRQGEAG